MRLDRLAEHAAGVGITARMGDRKAAAHHLDAFLRELRILTDSAAEVSPALVVAFGSRAILARVLAVHAQMRMRERLGLEITSSDVLRMLDKFGPTGPRAPTRGTFAELYAALGKKRPANRPLGASKLGESRDEVEGHIRDA
ncbi:MAG TPA: hypothetical protein VGS01_09400, partial [Candidatus Limnocylindria bacterium]|nr:hypothetical protein [Candidatus Limnocylindria bacterium]